MRGFCYRSELYGPYIISNSTDGSVLSKALESGIAIGEPKAPGIRMTVLHHERRKGFSDFYPFGYHTDCPRDLVAPAFFEDFSKICRGEPTPWKLVAVEASPCEIILKFWDTEFESRDYAERIGDGKYQALSIAPGYEWVHITPDECDITLGFIMPDSEDSVASTIIRFNECGGDRQLQITETMAQGGRKTIKAEAITPEKAADWNSHDGWQALISEYGR